MVFGIGTTSYYGDARYHLCGVHDGFIKDDPVITQDLQMCVFIPRILYLDS